MNNEQDYTVSSGNVFADLELKDAEESLMKAELARQIGVILRHRHITQAQAAEVLGVDQVRIAALLRGYLTGFSTEALFRFLNALGRDVEIRVTPKPRSRERAHIIVAADPDAKSSTGKPDTPRRAS